MGVCSQMSYFPKGYSLTEGGADMTAFEIISIVLGILTLVIASMALLLKLLVYLDSRFKRK